MKIGLSTSMLRCGWPKILMHGSRAFARHRMRQRSSSIWLHLEAEARETALASETERRFRDALNANRLDGDWDAAEGNPSEILMLAGRVHDVIVVKQTQEGVDEPGWDVPEACAVSSGTPTLVVPFEGSFPSIGERLLIAWNGSQQAAAA